MVGRGEVRNMPPNRGGHRPEMRRDMNVKQEDKSRPNDPKPSPQRNEGRNGPNHANDRGGAGAGDRTPKGPVSNQGNRNPPQGPQGNRQQQSNHSQPQKPNQSPSAPIKKDLPMKPEKPEKVEKRGDDDEEDIIGEIVIKEEKKFSGRNRLFVGNLPNDTSEDAFKKMFEPFGDVTEVFLNANRGFGFIRMDYRKNAESAKNHWDGQQRKGRVLRVRYAAHGGALRVTHLCPFVSNELLFQAFTTFGEVERAVVICDDRGKSTGEGIVEFARKPGAQAALKRINDGVFLMAASPRPVSVELCETKDDEDGLQERFISKGGDYNREREQVPRFAQAGTFEFDYGQKWKELYLLHEEQKMTIKRQFEEASGKLEVEQSNAMLEHQTSMLRQDLMRRQEELRRLEEQHQMEMQRKMDIRRQDEDRRRQEEERRRQDIEVRRQQQEERRQQELYVQQERAMREMRAERGAPPMQPPPAPPASLGIERSRQGVSRFGQGMGNGGSSALGGSTSSLASQGSTGGGSGGYGNNMQTSTSMRQSRFDQPPGYQQSSMSGASGMGGGGGGNPNNQSSLMSGGASGGMNRLGQGGPMGDERGMLGRRQGSAGERGMREEYFESKRPRRF